MEFENWMWSEGQEPKCPMCAKQGPWTMEHIGYWRCGSCETVCEYTMGFMIQKPERHDIISGTADKKVAKADVERMKGQDVPAIDRKWSEVNKAVCDFLRSDDVPS